MRHTLLSLVLFVTSSFASAQSISRAWQDIPDSLVGYLSRGSRIQLVDTYIITGHSDVQNKLEGRSSIDTLTTDFMQVRMSDALVIQLKKLPTAEGDSVLCLVRTFIGPACESEVELYSMSWDKISAIDINRYKLIEKPDTMSSDRFHELKAFLMPMLASASLSAEDDMLTITPSIPFSNPDVGNELKSLILQRKLKWGNKTFN